MLIDRKIAVTAFVKGKHDMNLDQCRDAVAHWTEEVGRIQAALTRAKSKLSGFKEALAEKKEGLK